MIVLEQFLAESNRIERIFHVKPTEIEAADKFLRLTKITIADMCEFVKVTQPDAELRNIVVEHDVMVVGAYVAPAGGPAIAAKLSAVLNQAASDLALAQGVQGRVERASYLAHLAYERLHPFTDGNGRSGRILWLWMMKGHPLAQFGFLHAWYYQTLRFSAPATVVDQKRNKGP